MSISMSPQTSIKLCSVPWGDTTKHTLYFETKTAQSAYFNGLTGLTVDDYQYIKKDSTIKIGINIELLVNYNYCYYTNYQQSITDQGIFKTPKTYYCYILGREYINENTTKLYIKTDVIQTYMTEILSDTTSISYINRQMVADDEDTISNGEILLPEGLETGEYIRTSEIGRTDLTYTVEEVRESQYIDWSSLSSSDARTTFFDGSTGPYMVIIGVTEDKLATNPQLQNTNKMYAGIYSGLTYYAFGSTYEIGKFLDYLNQTAAIDCLFSMFIAPVNVCYWSAYKSERTWTTEEYSSGSVNYITDTWTIRYFKLTGQTYVDMQTVTCTNELTFKCLDGSSYTPHNKKLYSYPFSYCQLINGNAQCMNYYYEYFNGNIPVFKIVGALSQGCSIMAYPYKYKGKTSNYEDILNMTKFPTCSWNTDSYTNWLTQTAVNRANTARYAQEDKSYNQIKGVVQSVVGGAALVGGVMTGNIGMAGKGLSAFASGVDSLNSANKSYDRTIDSLEAEKYQHSLVPDGVNNGNACTEIFYALGNYEFKAQAMTITGERAKQIDEYFDRFGYTVNRNANLKQAITNRSKWNYVKTAECNIKADIPDEDLSDIKIIFNEGITFWKNASEFYRYDLGGSNR